MMLPNRNFASAVAKVWSSELHNNATPQRDDRNTILECRMSIYMGGNADTRLIFVDGQLVHRVRQPVRKPRNHVSAEFWQTFLRFLTELQSGVIESVAIMLHSTLDGGIPRSRIYGSKQLKCFGVADKVRNHLDTRHLDIGSGSHTGWEFRTPNKLGALCKLYNPTLRRCHNAGGRLRVISCRSCRSTVLRCLTLDLRESLLRILLRCSCCKAIAHSHCITRRRKTDVRYALIA
mmetsp:Transcript_136076/g.221515  ORF Transcript_136076/g.221515 Transcript_136076/m.221515 type:complete len:234 (+) Transcript_136076:386-1087(+)